MKPLINKKITYSKYLWRIVYRQLKDVSAIPFFFLFAGKPIWLIEMDFKLTWGVGHGVL